MLGVIVEKWDGILFSIYNFVAGILYLIKYPQIHSIIKRNQELKDKHKDERCFIVLNGPSLNQYNLNFLKDEQVICTNFMFKSDLVKMIKPTYYCWLDSIFLVKKDWYAIQREIQERCPNVKIIVNMKGYRKDIDSGNIYYTYNKYKPNIFRLGPGIHKMSPGYQNVALYAINNAIYMGFKEIYLIGLNFTPGHFDHFENLSVESDDARKEEEKDKVCECYWDYAQAHYESFYLRKYADSQGVRIINLTKESYIRAFEFGKIEDFYQ